MGDIQETTTIKQVIKKVSELLKIALDNSDNYCIIEAYNKQHFLRFNTMSIKFINLNTGITKVITLASDNYFSPEWIEIVAREANAADGWRFAE